jgi:hypothetical protein
MGRFLLSKKKCGGEKKIEKSRKSEKKKITEKTES